jgi:hypothetical protein
MIGGPWPRPAGSRPSAIGMSSGWCRRLWRRASHAGVGRIRRCVEGERGEVPAVDSADHQLRQTGRWGHARATDEALPVPGWDPRV